MARATANCVCSICGKAFTATKKFNTRRDADSWEKWASEHFDTCPECAQQQRTEAFESENAAAIAEAEANGYPTLTGTDKQVGWANTLRKQFVDEFNGYAGKKPSESAKLVLRVILHDRISAKIWIDTRDESVRATANRYYAQILQRGANDLLPQSEEPTQQDSVAAIPAARKKYPIVTPEVQRHEGNVTIMLDDSSVSAQYVKDDDFRSVVKRLNFNWDSDKKVWTKEINSFTGDAAERASELVNHLLNAGFAVEAPPEIVNKGVSGDFEKECTRWVVSLISGTYSGWLCIKFEKNHDLYCAARKIKGSKYASPRVVVPVERYNEVLDFAKLYGFSISQGAQCLINEYKDSFVTVSPCPVKTNLAEDAQEKLDAILSSSSDVIPDLIDEDD